MLAALSIAAMTCTIIATLVMIVFNLTGAANASMQQVRSIKLWAGGLTLLAGACVVAGILLLRADQPGWAAGVSFAPTIIISVIFAIALLK